MTHTVKSLKALLREYKHLHSFAYSKMKKPVETSAPSGPSQEELLTQIRDLLKK